MTNNNLTIVGVFDDRATAEAVIKDLKKVGVSDEHISYVATSHEQQTTVTNEGARSSKAESAGRGAGAGAATGAVIGTVAGLAVAAGVLPGVGALLVAGPLAAALGLTGAAATATAGALTGAAAGGLIGGLAQLGIEDEETAKLYERRVREGGFLVAATATVDAGLRQIYEQHGAEEIREYS
jgi:hypothetical protein